MSLLSVVHYCENWSYPLVSMLSVVHYCENCLYNQRSTSSLQCYSVLSTIAQVMRKVSLKILIS